MCTPPYNLDGSITHVRLFNVAVVVAVVIIIVIISDVVLLVV